MDNWLEKLVDKDDLQDNLTFAAIFISLYENMVDYVKSGVRDFLCNICVKDGKMTYVETREYREKIRDCIVDDKGNKNPTKASFLWLIEQGAITFGDFDKFLQMKEVRNKYAHELDTVIMDGITENEITLLFDMHSLYSMISRWFFITIEAPIAGYKIPQNTDIDDIQNGANLIFNIILNVLYNGKSEEYKSIITTIKEGKKYEV